MAVVCDDFSQQEGPQSMTCNAATGEWNVDVSLAKCRSWFRRRHRLACTIPIAFPEQCLSRDNPSAGVFKLASKWARLSACGVTELCPHHQVVAEGVPGVCAAHCLRDIGCGGFAVEQSQGGGCLFYWRDEIAEATTVGDANYHLYLAE